MKFPPWIFKAECISSFDEPIEPNFDELLKFPSIIFKPFLNMFSPGFTPILKFSKVPPFIWNESLNIQPEMFIGG